MRVLSASQYDALVAAANAAGGLLSNRMFDSGFDDNGQPFFDTVCGCLYGAAWVAGVIPRRIPDLGATAKRIYELASADCWNASDNKFFGCSAVDADNAIDRVRHRMGLDPTDRVPVIPVLEGLNIVRGAD